MEYVFNSYEDLWTKLQTCRNDKDLHKLLKTRHDTIQRKAGCGSLFKVASLMSRAESWDWNHLRMDQVNRLPKLTGVTTQDDFKRSLEDPEKIVQYLEVIGGLYNCLKIIMYRCFNLRLSCIL